MSKLSDAVDAGLKRARKNLNQPSNSEGPIMIELGRVYLDRITGFKGIATGHVVYITGCNQVLLAPRCKPDGGDVASAWFDEQRVILSPEDEHTHIVLDNGRTPGPDRAAPIR